MSRKNQHIIHRQILDLELGAGLSDVEIREKYQDELAEKMSEVMDAVFGELSPEEELLLIDKLELDLGECTEENFLPLFKSSIKQQIQEVRGKEPGKHKSREGDAKKLLAEHRQFELFVFFLEKGYFPWWAEKTDLKEFEKSLLEHFEKREIKSDEWMHVILSNTYMAKRLSRQFSFRINFYLLKRIYPKIATKLEKTLTFMSGVFQDIPGISPSIDKRIFESILMESVWVNIAEPDFGEQIDNLAEKIIAEIILKQDLPAGEAITYLEKIINIVPEKIKKILKKKAAKVPEKPKKLKKDEKKAHTEAEELMIENAGIVILCSFLKEFYEKMNLLIEKDFKSENHQERAVLLSQYLVTGETALYEHHLAFNKIINGWPLEKPVKSKLEMTLAERQIAEDFLKKVIENWPALKNTSPAALQETFLQRDGLLKPNKDSWNLKVERKTVDVLRDSLPWAVNIISLPWMDTIIYVKW